MLLFDARRDTEGERAAAGQPRQAAADASVGRAWLDRSVAISSGGMPPFDRAGRRAFMPATQEVSHGGTRRENTARRHLRYREYFLQYDRIDAPLI